MAPAVSCVTNFVETSSKKLAGWLATLVQQNSARAGVHKQWAEDHEEVRRRLPVNNGLSDSLKKQLHPLDLPRILQMVGPFLLSSPISSGNYL
jgi:hypothetical protein